MGFEKQWRPRIQGLHRLDLGLFFFLKQNIRMQRILLKGTIYY